MPCHEMIVGMTITRCSILFLLVLATAPLRAADFTLFGGVQNLGKLTLQSAVDTTRTIPLDPRTFGTFGIRFSTGGVLGNETTFAYSPNFISSDQNAVILNTNLIVQAPLEDFRPYATAGLGTVYIRGDTISALEAVTGGKFAINYGGGVKIKLSGPVGGQFDVRGYTLTGVQSEKLNVIEATVGIVFSF